MADEHETESQAWAIEAAAAEAASRAAEEVHRPPVVPMERVVDRTDIERGERAGQKRSQEPGFPRFFAELNLGLILTAFAIVAFKTPNHFAFGGTSGVSVILSTLFPTLPVGVFMWIINAVLVVLGFIFHAQLGLESCTIALTAAAVMLLIGHQDIEEVITGVEWTTILFFTGLFVVVGGLQETGIIQVLANGLMDLTKGHMTMTILLILWVSAIVSSFLDNIPFVATLIPLILTMQSSGVDVTPLWWAVSLGACLGGNGTLIGASANVVLSGISTRHGFPITFASYFKVGFPMMLVSVAISTVFLLIRFG